MLLLTTVPVVLIATFAGGQTDSASIRSQEEALATALRTRDKTALIRLTDANLHVSVECGSAERTFHTVFARDEWLDGVSRLRIDSYVTNTSKIYLLTGRHPDDKTVNYNTLAMVTVTEHLQIRLPHGRTIRKEFTEQDSWAKQDGTWKLAGRSYMADACHDVPQDAGPHLVFP